MARSAVLRSIRDHTSLTAKYDNYFRFFSPHALGTDMSGHRVVLAFQYGGGMPGGLPHGGQWRCFALSKLSQVHVNRDGWHCGPADTGPLAELSAIELIAGDEPLRNLIVFAPDANDSEV